MVASVDKVAWNLLQFLVLILQFLVLIVTGKLMEKDIQSFFKISAVMLSICTILLLIRYCRAPDSFKIHE